MRRPIFALWLVGVLLSNWCAAAVPADKAGLPPGKPKANASHDDYYELFKILADTMDQVERNYVKQVDRRELVEAAIQGMLGKLDPYSSYINPNELSNFRTTVENEFGGIGIQPAPDNGPLRVFSPLVGTPAYRAGLLAGDRIVAIDGKSTAGIKLDEAVRRLKGEAGTQVTLTVIHPGSGQEQKLTITREIIHVDTVLGDHRGPDDRWDFMLDRDRRIGYIRLTAFSRDTARDLRKALEQLRADGLRGLILDLRSNPGGLLNSAIEICNLFVSQGRIVSTSGRNSPERIWNAHGKDRFSGFPMVVLVNRYSASASEIVSACLQDHKRALIVGERTWGKGSVQNVIELEGGRSLLRLTTAHYVRPSGKNIDRPSHPKESDEWGVIPDPGYRLELDDEELKLLTSDRWERDVVRPHQGLAAAQAPSSVKSPATAPAVPAAQPRAKADAADGKKPIVEKPVVEKPIVEKPAAATPVAGKSGSPGKFVDRQLQMAVTYLSGELARAGR
jgi:carboxyl-terminal processing protease